MRHRVALVLYVAALACAPLALACRPAGAPSSGDSLGTFAVRGTLEENACAPGLDASDRLEFRVDLTRDHRALTWRMQGGAPVFGTVEDDGEFRVRTGAEIEAWPPDPATGVRGCRVTQIETIDGVLAVPPGQGDGGLPGDAGAAGDAGPSMTASFEADSRIEIVPVAGTDCSALLLVNGGSFPTLPCVARYELEGRAD